MDKVRHPRELVLPIVAMAFIVLISNILVQFLLGSWLTWGALTYPFAFLITDLTNRFYGKHAAAKVVLWGFFVGVFCSFMGTQISGEFGPLVTFRIAIGSAAGFLVSQLLDISIFNLLRNKKWWKAPLISSLLGSAIDTSIFFFIAFSASLAFLEPSNDISWALQKGPVLGFFGFAPLWISLALADFLLKMALIIFSLIPFRIFTIFKYLKANS